MKAVSMRYLMYFCFSFVLASNLEAVQMQIRAFHSQAKISQLGAVENVEWTASYLNSLSQTTRSYNSASQRILNSPGQEITLGFFLTPSFLLDLGLAQTQYYLAAQERVESLAPKLGLQFITNVQGRWMPFFRTGLAFQQLQLFSNRIETRTLPPSLGLTRETDRFGVQKWWMEPARFLNGDLGLGLKFFLYPTTGFNLEYRYSASLQAITLTQRAEGTSSFQNQSGFVSTSEWNDARFESHELSLGVEVEI